MSLTPINTGTSVVPDPTKVVKVISSGTPANDGSWTTTSARTLYTAPATVSSAQIYFPLAADVTYATRIESNTSQGFTLQVLTSKGFVRQILNTKNASEVGLNLIQYWQTAGGTYDSSITTFKWGDVYVNWKQTSFNKHFILPADIFTLGPGDSFQIGTTSDSSSSNTQIQFDVWEY